MKKNIIITGIFYLLYNQPKYKNRNLKKKNETILEDVKENKVNDISDNFIKEKFTKVDDYEYYPDFNFNYSKENDNFNFNLNGNDVFKFIKNKNGHFLEVKLLKKLFKVDILEDNKKKLKCNLRYKPNFIEKFCHLINSKEYNIDFYFYENKKNIIIEILNVDKISDVLNVIKKINIDFFEFLSRKNYKILFDKK